MATANISLEIGAVPEGLPLEDAPLGVQHDLDNSGGWSGAASVQWKLLVPPGSSAVLTHPGLLVGAPFTNDFTPDVPGGYLVHLKITNTGGSVSTHRVVIAVKDPCTRVAPGAPYELGADPDDPSPNPTRDATYGWAHVEAEQSSLAALGALSDDKTVTIRNATGAPIAAGKVCKVTAVEVYKGRVADGVAPALAKRRYVYLTIIVDGTAISDMRAGNTLVMAKEAIADGAYGLALLRGFVQHDTSGDVAGDLWCVDATGSFASLSPARICRPVARVAWSALDTADPPGIFYFDGTPTLTLEIGATATKGYKQVQTAGAPVFGLSVETDGVCEKLTCNAANDVGTHYQEYVAHRPIGTWSDQDVLFRFHFRSSDVSETQIGLDIDDPLGNNLLGGVIPWTVGDNVWQILEISRGDLAFAGGQEEPLMAGSRFRATVAVAFSAIAIGGEQADWRDLICGPGKT